MKCINLDGEQEIHNKCVDGKSLLKWKRSRRFTRQITFLFIEKIALLLIEKVEDKLLFRK